MARRVSTLGYACLEASDYEVEGAPVKAYGGSRARFALGLERASFGDPRFLYDFAGTARSARLLWPRRPYAVWAHGIEVWDEVRPDRAAALARAEIVLVNSAYTRDRAAPTLSRLRDVRLCRLGAFSDEQPPPQVGDGPPTVLLLGRVEPGWPKGQGVLVSLWPRVVAAVPGARLLLVGKGPALEALRDLARASPAAADIEVAGFVPEAEIEAVCAVRTVFAMPSLTEGFGSGVHRGDAARVAGDRLARRRRPGGQCRRGDRLHAGARRTRAGWWMRWSLCCATAISRRGWERPGRRAGGRNSRSRRSSGGLFRRWAIS